MHILFGSKGFYYVENKELIKEKFGANSGILRRKLKLSLRVGSLANPFSFLNAISSKPIKERKMFL